jgi:hypothetical protein
VRGIVFAQDESVVHKESPGRKPDVPAPALPPRRFASGKSWISAEQKKKMATRYGVWLQNRQTRYKRVLVYARGSYLAAVRMAEAQYNIRITELLDPTELTSFKRKGWVWMKVGLRMPEVFEVFQERIQEIEENRFGGQMRLF